MIDARRERLERLLCSSRTLGTAVNRLQAKTMGFCVLYVSLGREIVGCGRPPLGYCRAGLADHTTEERDMATARHGILLAWPGLGMSE
jgi:hypothetical protein